MIKIPSDLRKNKETIIGNLDTRESISIILGSVVSITILYYIKIVLKVESVIMPTFFAGLFIIPFIIIGFKKIRGMKIEEYIKVKINNTILASRERENICENGEREIKKKNEIIRVYQIKRKEDLKNVIEEVEEKLIMTEYIDYKNEKMVVIRIDGREMIKEAINKNKEEIKEIEKEIKKNNDKEKVKELKKKKKEKERKKYEEIKKEIEVIKSDGIEKVEEEKIKEIKKELEKEEREIYELNLFGKEKYKEYMEKVEEKIVFINRENKVDTFVIEKEKIEMLVDKIKIDKKEKGYKATIVNMEARNRYNHYRKIKRIEEII